VILCELRLVHFVDCWCTVVYVYCLQIIKYNEFCCVSAFVVAYQTYRILWHCWKVEVVVHTAQACIIQYVVLL